MVKLMQAARLHSIGEPFKVDTIPVPDVRPTDVLVEVKSAGVVPNLRNVITHYPEWFPFMPLPSLPAIYGLDASGIVAEVGSHVTEDISPGDRVYVNPGLSCGSCTACRRGETLDCSSYTFHGYFGFGPGSHRIFADYPHGGFSQFLTAPATNLVKLPDSVSFDQAARFGYLGTSYAALRKANFAAGQTVLVDGGTGTLGLGAVILALAMGAAKIFATGRDVALLDRLKALAPRRVDVIRLGDRPTSEIVMAATGNYGVDVMIQALGANAPVATVVDSLGALRRGGKAVLIGGVAEPIPIEPFPFMGLQQTIIGSRWFSTAEGQDMAAMAASGTLDLSVFEHERFSLAEVNEALDATDQRNGGFTNVVVNHG